MPDLEKQPIEGVLKAAEDESADNGEVTIAMLLEAFGDRSFGPWLATLGLLSVSPLGAVPGIPAMLAIATILLASQLLIGRCQPWLPARVKQVGFDRDALVRFSDPKDVRGKWLQRIDRLITSRLPWATSRPIRALAAGACILLAAAMIPLELLPFAVALPGTAITLFGLAITARDGLLMLLAMALTAATLGTAVLPWL